MNIKELRKLCKELMITHWVQIEDGSINVHADVNLMNKGLDRIPIKFNIVYGEFIISNNNLTSLENTPNKISGNLYASNNKLKNLIGCPKYVNGRLSFKHNPLESLDGYDGNYNKIIADNIEKFIRKKKITEILDNI